MKAIVREHFETEIRNAQAATATRDFEAAWTALQRAHILGQAYALPHALAHWEMLRLAWRQRDTKEVAGQFVLIAFTPLLLFGVGQGRTLRGGKVSIDTSERMSIPDDLRQILDQ